MLRTPHFNFTAAVALILAPLLGTAIWIGVFWVLSGLFTAR
jgi:hypothetical protein